MRERVIIKLGGSLLSPHETSEENIKNGIIPFDFEYAKQLINHIKQTEHEYAIVIGGGYINSWYVNSLKLKNLYSDSVVNDFHTIGMSVSTVNASIFRILLEKEFGKGEVYEKVVKHSDYDKLEELKPDLKKSRIIVASGWKPGHSHDVDAIMLAGLFSSNQVLSFKNIDGIYSADPNKDPSAKKKKILTWSEYRSIIHVTMHEPRASFPIDAIAATLAEKAKIGFTVLDGRNFSAVKEAIETKLCQYGSVVKAE